MWLRFSILLLPSLFAASSASSLSVHRPLYHLTPVGRSKDPNGMFYDIQHKRYHVFCQFFGTVLPNGATEPGWHPAGPHWWHYSAPSWAGPWKSHGDSNITGGSGGAVLSPDGTPSLLAGTIWLGTVWVPANRSDPELLHWRQTIPNPKAR
jgi:hypothetical protein